MARPLKPGLEYFPLDVDYFSDEKFQFVVAKCGIIGEVVCIRLFAKIYRNSYYTRWTEDDALLFSMSVNLKIETVTEIISEATKRGLFCAEMLRENSILTSHGIQSRYIKACGDSHRKNTVIEQCFNLLPTKSELTTNKPELTTSKPELTDKEIPQSKVKESKVKESKVKESKENEIKVEEKESKRDEENNPKLTQSPFEIFLNQNKIFNQTNFEFLSSEEWFNVKAMQLGSSLIRINDSSKEFIIDLRDRDMLEGKTLIDLRSHFVSWFKKHRPKVTNGSSFIPSLEDRSDAGISREKEEPSLEKYLLGRGAFLSYATDSLKLTTDQLKEQIKKFQAYSDESGKDWSNIADTASKFIDWYQQNKNI